MNKKIILTLTILSSFLITACSGSAKNRQHPIKKDEKRNTTCPVLKSEKWHAWLDTYQQPEGSYRLKVSGEILLPNPSYKIEWSEGPTDRMTPPGIRLLLNPVEAEGMSIQVITQIKVEYKTETPVPSYKHVSIYCKGKLLAQIQGVTLID